jgi:hypothetical protein
MLSRLPHLASLPRMGRSRRLLPWLSFLAALPLLLGALRWRRLHKKLRMLPDEGERIY